MKKVFAVGGICVVIILVLNFFANSSFDVEGNVLLYLQEDDHKGLTVYDCVKDEFQQIDAFGLQAEFSNRGTILLNRFDEIKEYDLETKEEKVVYQGEAFDYFTVCNDNVLSLSDDSYIFYYNIQTQEKHILVEDNGSEIHSWSDDGTILYYTDKDYKIISLNVTSGEKKEIGTGYDPIEQEGNIAYKDKESLIVKNISTGKEYKYKGAAYDYCFSPSGNEVLVKDEMSLITGIKNFFTNDMVLGHRIVVWQFETGKKKTIVDDCLDGSRLLDWS